MFHMLVIIPYMERFGAGMLLPLCMLSGWCVRFGAGMLVPLECRCKVLVEGVACCQSGVYSLERACWCRCRVLLQGAAVKVVCALELACWCHCRMLLQGSQNTSSDLANAPRFRIGKFEAWFGYDSGYDSETLFFGIQEALLLESLFLSVNLPQLLRCNGSTCQTTLGRTWIHWIWRVWRSKYTSLIYIRRPAGVSSGCSSDVPLAQQCF